MKIAMKALWSLIFLISQLAIGASPPAGQSTSPVDARIKSHEDLYG